MGASENSNITKVHNRRGAKGLGYLQSCSYHLVVRLVRVYETSDIKSMSSLTNYTVRVRVDVPNNNKGGESWL